MFIDAVGKACPMPVILAKKEIEKNHGSFVIAVDNQVAVENLKKLAAKMAYFIQVQEKDGNLQVFFNTDPNEKVVVAETNEETTVVATKGQYTVFVGKESLGQGDDQLGALLMEMFFYTLSQEKDLPESILFMNGGVRIVTTEGRALNHLKSLQEQGVKLLVCGTCLDYFSLTGELKIGEISNMYEITEKMLNAQKVVTL